MTKTSATNAANTTNYAVTTHAIDRARLRFGINTEHVAQWINGLMAKAKFVTQNGRNQSVYVSEGVRLIVDHVSNNVITLYNEVSTDFLQPVIERELRKMERNHTQRTRQIELDRAETLVKYAEMAVNHAKARNPQTRALIAGRMSELQAIIDGYDERVSMIEDEFDTQRRAMELIAN